MENIDWKTKHNKQLIEAILSLKTPEEAGRFLRDLMTEKEITEFANRLEAASLLTKNTLYTEITKKTGLSSATVARISKWLNGSLGGYRLILSRLHHGPSRLGKGLSLNA